MKNEIAALLTATEAIRQAIEAVGPGGIPSGHLYAHVMEHMDLATYDRIVGLLVDAGVVSRGPNHLLRALPLPARSQIA